MLINCFKTTTKVKGIRIMIDKTKNIETSIEDENIFTYLELPSRILLYMNGKPAMGKFHLFIECIFYASVNIKKYVIIVSEMDVLVAL